MKEYPAEFWNERYGNHEYIHGIQPNAFFKEQIDKLKPGSILLPAEGEGRNAVYAALNGWKVTAFDISKNAREKALQLAKTNNVFIDFKVKDVLDFNIGEQFDVIGLSYAHFPAEIRKQAYQHLINLLRPKGKIILEAFAKSQLGNPSGGPKNVDMLFSLAEIEEEFSELKFEVLEQKSIELEEGENHKGKAEVIRFVGIK
jgi:SAM-dependent methyltransferase